MKKHPWFSLLAALALVIMAGAPPFVQPAQAASPDIVISQVYGGGGNTNATYKQDFVELFNRGTAPVSLAGWSIQYASTTGTGNFGSSTTQITELPSVTLQPGQYYLIQEAQGTGGTTDLPAPDLIDASPIAIAGTGGKVALATTNVSLGCNGSSTPCSPAQLTLIKDLVGWDGANFYETAAAPATSNTTAIFRNNGGCTDTDNNSVDFGPAAAPAPRNTASPVHYCTGPTNPSGVGAANPNAVFPGDPTLLTVTVTPGANPPSTGLAVSADLTSIGGSNPQAFYDDGTNGDVTSGDNVFSFAATVDVATVPGAKTLPIAVADAQSRTAVTTIGLTVNAPPVAIHDVQGAGHISPQNSQTVTLLPAIVTALRTTGGTRGFYLQDQEANYDADPATSEGIFVFTGGSSNPAALVAVGDLVQVSGKVSEYRGAAASLTLTELVAPYTDHYDFQRQPAARADRPRHRRPDPALGGHRGRCQRQRRDHRRVRPGQRRHRLLRKPGRHAGAGERRRGRRPTHDFTSNREIPVVGDNGANAGRAHQPRRRRRPGHRLQPRAHHPERLDRRRPDPAACQCGRHVPRRHRRRDRLQLQQLQAAGHLDARRSSPAA